MIDNPNRSKSGKTLIVLLIVTLVVVGPALLGALHDGQRNTLSKERSRTGVITDIGLMQTGRKNIYHDFYLVLDRSPSRYVVERNDHGYSDLFSALNIGDSVRVFYRDGPENQQTAIQIELKHKTVYFFSEYQKTQSSITGFVLIIGIFLGLAVLIFYGGFNPVTFLWGVVDGQKKFRSNRH